MKAASAGSLLAWFTPVEPGPSLVVHDTREHQVVAQVRVPGCLSGLCGVVTVAGDRVYWSEADDGTAEHGLMVLEISRGTISATDEGALSAHLRGLPRGFVKGDSFTDGEVVTHDVSPENVYVEPNGSSLELRRLIRETTDGEAVDGYGGFDTTGRELHLRLPDGYRPAPVDYTLFQWLDDDRFAVMAGAAHNEFGWNGFPGYGDILVCNIARERCTLAANGPTRRQLPDRSTSGRPELTPARRSAAARQTPRALTRAVRGSRGPHRRRRRLQSGRIRVPRRSRLDCRRQARSWSAVRWHLELESVPRSGA